MIVKDFETGLLHLQSFHLLKRTFDSLCSVSLVNLDTSLLHSTDIFFNDKR